MNENKNNEMQNSGAGSSSDAYCAMRVSAGGCRGRCNLRSTNWLDDVPGDMGNFDIVEVHFKNTRRGFYRNSAGLDLHIGDMVAVEANPGHDIGEVAMVGKLVKLQMRRANLKPDAEILRVFRKAKPADLERYEEAKSREVDTMIRSRQIAVDLGLKMKIGDVEYQGDGNKAIFYYIADERVDFRQLIKVLAEVFKIRVEMKQIGARQEAGRIGGIGPCGRPLCCASWMTNFVSVATNAARFQDISLNPQKLAGQCAKLKCCINFEVDTYMEASREMPSQEIVLETKDKEYFHFKTDVLKHEMYYSTKKGVPENLVILPVERVYEVISLNENGVKPEKLALDDAEREFEKNAFGDILSQDAINRFDKKKKKKAKKNREARSSEVPKGVENSDIHNNDAEPRDKTPRGDESQHETRFHRQRDEGRRRQGERRRGERKAFRPHDNKGQDNSTNDPNNK